jgi:hypothetical protein
MRSGRVGGSISQTISKERIGQILPGICQARRALAVPRQKHRRSTPRRDRHPRDRSETNGRAVR